MPPFKPIKRNELISFLRKSGYDGPYSGGKHQFMVKGNKTIVIPNPHAGDIGTGFLSRILKQANISKEEWESL